MIELMMKSSFGGNFPVKLEVEDSLEDEHAPLTKRSKSSNLNQWDAGNDEFPVPPPEYNPLDEPSPLGLRLRKSPSLLDLIQMRLSQNNASSVAASVPENPTAVSNKETRGAATSVATDKLKASNFSGSLLRIGSWEYASRYEGDLVAKCYFAKHKLVWEILEGGLKSKIEIQWSDIMGLKAVCPENGTGSLTIVLARQPLFFRETNPQPRKHTLWQATSDFTDGQASLNRQHFLQCPPGVLNKHYEKLIQCDVRLNFLSQQPELALESPYFDTKATVFENLDELNAHGLDPVSSGKGSPLSSIQDAASPAAAQSSSVSFEQPDLLGAAPERLFRDAPSPSSSVMNTRSVGENANSLGNDPHGMPNLEQLKVPGLRPSMSMTDLVSHIENCISEQINSGNLQSDDALECKGMLEDIAQMWLSDTQCTTASDEKSLMKKVNSLCCLLQDPTTSHESHFNGENHLQKPIQSNNACSSSACESSKGNDEENAKDFVGGKPTPSIPRRDSFGDLLLHLPRIASLPKFLFDIAEDDENQAR
ncbi:hypothetical protein K7X08_022675 [Anisodus acutangulus]|uniref:TRF2/HOY1 PH-like domain-containing protein n=1 Tax=Anisodus acutangulus TaxID=402998 RepID=A0A9Q1MI75_9SOLA|nr:hypothetical protein K7X08_022675 [Anisodus acutangulus]